MDERLASLADEVRAANTVVAFTGAGVSTASGIPSFRGEDGVWKTQFHPNDFSYGRLLSKPAGFWTDRLALHEAMYPDDAAPNPAHEALTAMESAGRLSAVVTQNTDGLHLAAGSRRVVELHGNNSRVVCLDCGERSDAAAARARVRDGDNPPHCDCGGLLKPDVVLFGESLPEDEMAEASRLARESDVFLAIGSSLTVEPAASLPTTAAQNGTLAVLNREETPADRHADYVFREDVTDLLPALADTVV
ncbi:NAD-dependent protein deacylase [Halobium salinum]|uniref:NAD-dependent protein deacylase n=1 Tax=Halobium salinum TaxID=1364940 RepID=A0ABD5PDC6_9EURY|nr:Sir2 family NAD-dependent protein deacetylase [Halobium salinum]